MDDRDDEDRAAILKRRSRFIAVALAGMTAGCDNLNPFAPCLEPMPVEQPVGDPEGTPPVEMRPIPQPPMQPNMTAMEEPVMEEVSTQEPVMEETAMDDPAMRPRMRPQPCLTPRVCLSVAPRVCLELSLEGAQKRSEKE
jgi:hypothetical protein